MTLPPDVCAACGATGTEVLKSDGRWVCWRCFAARSTVAVPLEAAPGDTDPDGRASAARSSATPRVTRADRAALRAKRLGLAPPGLVGACVLPGHDHDAGLVPTSRGHWVLWCELCRAQFSCAEVRGIHAYADVPYGDGSDDRRDAAWARVRRPSAVEVSRWAELLDFECGLRACGATNIIEPAGLSANAAKTLAAIRRLLGLRDARWDGQDFTFARRFCRARTGLSDAEARAAVEELRLRGVIAKTGRSGRAITYRCGTRAEVRDTQLGDARACDDVFINETEIVLEASEQRA